MTEPEGPHAVDIDELAREKVQEIEKLLSSRIVANNCDIKTFDSCFIILKQIITAADLHRTNNKDDAKQSNGSTRPDIGESIYADYSDDNEQFTAADLTERFATNSVKWTIRVQAFKIVHQLVQIITDAHISSRQNTSKTPVLKFLPDLVRLSFVAATSPYDELKIQGFEMFRFLIKKFSHVNEREFPGHSILEQYKTQVFSAIKPAFNLDAPPYITAIACQVCCLWICHGLDKDVIDLTRAYQLLLISIEKLDNQSANQNSKLYTESELEQERLEILGSWAQLYISAMEHSLNDSDKIYNRLSASESKILYGIVEKKIPSLVSKWWEALKDYALLIMPSPRLIGTSHDNGDVFTREVALKLFDPIWPNLLIALTIWLSRSNSQRVSANNNHDSSEIDGLPICDDIKLQLDDHNKLSDHAKYVKFLNGITMRELCKVQVHSKKNPNSIIPWSTIVAIKALRLLISDANIGFVILEDMKVTQEFYCSLYSILVSYCRDPNRQIVKTTLDLIFQSTLEKFIHKKVSTHYGLAKSIVALMQTMRDIEIACNEKSGDIDCHRMHLSIRLCNLLAIIKMSPRETMDEIPLREAVVVVFQEMLQFTSGAFVANHLLEQLHDLYQNLTQEHLFYITENLFKLQVKRITELLCSIDKTSLIQAESHLKTMRSAIYFSEGTNRTKLMNLYIEVLLKSVPDDVPTTPGEGISDFCIKQIESLLKLLSINSFEGLDKKLETLMRRNAAKNKIATTATKKQVTISRQPAKITLRTDFSNF